MRYLLFFFVLCTLNLVSAQENWTKYPVNPVLKRDTVLLNLPNDYIAISDPWVLKDGSQFKMWYTCGGLNYPTDTLLRSRICLCESSDGVNWVKYAGNPVMDVDYSGSWDSLGVETVSILMDDSAPLSERYKMWYAGQYFNAYRYDIGYATSPDGINWSKYASPVVQVGAAADWDGGFIEGPSVLKEGNTYKMWYAGYSLVNGKTNLGYATSTDGMNWSKYTGNPVMEVTPGEWDSIYVQDPHVLKIGNEYHMWYGGASQYDFYGQETGYAHSVDGINWVKSPANPVLTRGGIGNWDANTASFPSVMLDADTLKLWYTGKDIDPIPANSTDYYWEIGYATELTHGLGIQTMTGNEVLVVYPNPFSISATVKTNFDLSTAQIAVYDLSGQEVRVIEKVSGNSFTFSREMLNSGIYFLQIHTASQAIITEKLILCD